MTGTKRDIRETLVERVERKVAGRGIPRRAVEAAVSRVVEALDAAPAGAAAAAPAAGGPPIVAALTARSAPDLASRVRRALAAEGVTELDLGVATAGQHTVVTVRAGATARAALERAASALGASLSVVA